MLINYSFFGSGLIWALGGACDEEKKSIKNTVKSLCTVSFFYDSTDLCYVIPNSLFFLQTQIMRLAIVWNQSLPFSLSLSRSWAFPGKKKKMSGPYQGKLTWITYLFFTWFRRQGDPTVLQYCSILIRLFPFSWKACLIFCFNSRSDFFSRDLRGKGISHPIRGICNDRFLGLENLYFDLFFLFCFLDMLSNKRMW